MRSAMPWRRSASSWNGCRSRRSPCGARSSPRSDERPSTREEPAVQISESFVVEVPAAAVWQFFEQIERVARCVPGVQQVDVMAPDRYKLVVAQTVGFISATFEMTTQVVAKAPLQYLELSSVGRSIKGAVGNLRSKDRVQFEPEDGGTRVTLISDLAVGGMLGALGHKVIVSKSKEITAKFAERLRAELQSSASE